jgi:hypothetical protein
LFLLDDQQLKADVELNDGRTTAVVVDKQQACYGVSSFADVKIELQDIKSITVHGKAY